MVFDGLAPVAGVAELVDEAAAASVEFEEPLPMDPELLPIEPELLPIEPELLPIEPELPPMDPELPPIDDDVEVDGCVPVEPDAPLEAWPDSDACSAAWVFGPIMPSIGPGSKPWSFSDCCSCLTDASPPDVALSELEIAVSLDADGALIEGDAVEALVSLEDGAVVLDGAAVLD